MNVHGALYHCVGRLGVHDIEYAMDDLVTFESQEGGAQYLFVISIHKDFHETLGLTSLIRANDILHCHSRDQRRLARLTDFGFRHPGAAKWRIGVERVGRDAVAHSSLIVTLTSLLSTRTSMPSSLRKPAIACETSSSSGEIKRGPNSITVTSLPKRR